MEINDAILAFSQSEKIKSSIIWASQAVEIFSSLSEEEKPGANKIIRAVISMIGHEIPTHSGPKSNRVLIQPW